MGLFKPGWMRKNEVKALRSVSRLSEATALAEAARMSPHKSVCLAALDKIDDRQLLLQIAASSEYPHCCTAVMDKVKDPAFDEQVALQSSLESGLAAFHRINDPQALERIAKEAQHPGIRAAAAGKMENLSQLVHQAQTAPNRTERRKAAAQYVQLAGAFYISNYETHFSFGIKDAVGILLEAVKDNKEDKEAGRALLSLYEANKAGGWSGPKPVHTSTHSDTKHVDCNDSSIASCTDFTDTWYEHTDSDVDHDDHSDTYTAA